MNNAGDAEPRCPKNIMMSDLYAYGDYWGMRSYNNIMCYEDFYRAVLRRLRSSLVFVCCSTLLRPRRRSGLLLLLLLLLLLQKDCKRIAAASC